MTELLKKAKTLMDHSWFWYFVLGIPVAVLAFVTFYQFWSYSQTIARLQTEKEKAAEAAKNLKLQLEMEAIEDKKRVLTEEIAQTKVKEERIELEIEGLQDVYEVEIADIGAIDNWGDFWNHLGQKPPTTEDPPSTDPHN